MDPKVKLWQPAVAGPSNGTSQTFKGDNGQTYTINGTEITPQTVTLMHQSSVDGVEDMAVLGDLHEGAILLNIKQRYQQDLIYTYIGSIIAAINPYKKIDMYGADKILEYKDVPIGEKAPHIYAVANEAYSALWKKDRNQVVLISGESGAGKTESTKFILNFFGHLSNDVSSTAGHVTEGSTFEERITQSSPILESFGNAKTVYNNNSSRFGKFIAIFFNTGGIIEGGEVTDFLLEKNRVVRVNAEERSFHIFYALTAQPLDPKYKLEPNPEKYNYLKMSGVSKVATIDDSADYKEIMEAFKVMNFTDSQVEITHFIIAAILNLGNVQFVTQAGAQVKDRQTIEDVAQLLQIDASELADSLTLERRQIRGEVITTPLDVKQAEDTRDSLSMGLYSRIFKWIIQKINVSLKGSKTFHSIGVLDIFGFENFTDNYLEQFNINYANEKLQQYFNRHIFSLEQLEYEREGIPWSEIAFVDNGECLDLIEMKVGMVKLMDEESLLKKGNDESLILKLHNSHGSNGNPFYIKPKIAKGKGQFGIKHYAGPVLYEIDGLVEKNRDNFRDDLTEMMQQSKSDFIFDLFETKGAASGSRNTSRKKKMLVVQFKESLTLLMKMLSDANPYFVRCLKPNMEKVKGNFRDDTVMNQLRYSGMLETVRIRRAGFPVRRPFTDFMFRYRALAAGMSKDGEEKDHCAAVCKQVDPSGQDWKIGHTKVFYREKVETQLERQRQVALKDTIAKIQAAVLSAVAKMRFARIQDATVKLQAWWKMVFYRRKFLKERNAALRVQAVFRGYKARQEFADLLEAKRLEKEAKREIERQAEEDRIAEKASQAEADRLAAIAKQEEIKRLEAEAAAASAEEAEEAKRKLAAAKKAEEEAAAKAEEDARLLKEKEEAELAAKIEQEAADKAKLSEDVAKAQELQEAHAVAEKKAADEKEQAELVEEMEKKRQVALKAQNAADEDAAYVEAPEEMDNDNDDDDDDNDGGDDEDFDDFDDDDGFGDYREGFLGMYQGVMKALKKRWVVLHEGTLMWFKGQQNFIKAGWMQKMGGGNSTFGRKNWKRRWMTLKGGELHYHESEDDDANILGIVDVQGCNGIVSCNDPDFPASIKKEKKENAFSIITEKRTYFFSCDTPEESEAWVNTLNMVKGATHGDIKSMMANARVDPSNAVGTVDTEDIVSVGKVDKDPVGHPVFVVILNNRVEKFIAADEDDMDDWIRVLQPAQRPGGGDDNDEEPTLAGWMQKGGGDKGLVKRRRYFVLRGDVLSYSKTPAPDSFIGSVPLSSLCSVDPPDEVKAEKANDWTFSVHARKKSYQLTCKNQGECNRWINCLQDVIDNCKIIETDTEKMIDELKMASLQEVEAIYLSQKVLTYSTSPLRSPLLPLPYGEPYESPGGRAYGTLQQEAVKIAHSLLTIAVTGNPSAPRYGEPKPEKEVALIKAICQACFDVPKLRNEVYCQVIKATSNYPEPGDDMNMVHWHLLGALCSSFLPARKFHKFLRFHLNRTKELGDEKSCEEVVQMAQFCLDAIKKTKTRDFPPSTNEIKGIISGAGLSVQVHRVPDQVEDFTVTSSTTCGEIITEMKKKLSLENCANGFGLFEKCGSVDKYLDDKIFVADVLSKWEKYESHGINPDGGNWTLVFKLFSFYDPLNPKLSEVEQHFLFEQAFESVMNRQYPASDEDLVKLAALRMQYVVGDYEEGAYISDVVKVHPAQQAQLLGGSGSTIGVSSTLRKVATLAKGTLRGFGKGTLRKLRGGGTKKSGESEEEVNVIKGKIVEQWTRCKKMTQDDARIGYMDIIHSWNGYGSNLFDVEQTSKKDWPKELWLAISLEGVGIFPRNERKCLAFHRYESVLSFGAPVANKYKIMVDQYGSMLFETNMVLEIAKLMKEYIKEIVTRNK